MITPVTDGPDEASDAYLPGLVSVIIPVFNRPVLVVESIESVIRQNYRPLEIVLVDDGSTDSTPAVLTALQQRHEEIVILRQENAGPGAARNLGLSRARGEFIQFLDSDDLIAPDKIRRHVEALRADPSCAAAWSDTMLILPDGTRRTQYSAVAETRPRTMFPGMLRERFWITAAPLYRTIAIRSAGPFLPLRSEEDWEYDCRIAAAGATVSYVPMIGCFHRRHAGNLSATVTSNALADRAVAHRSIFGHAMRAGIGPDTEEMRHFARELFLLSRQCGAAGLREQSRDLFRLAREASGDRRNSLDFLLYSLLARMVGWRVAGRASAALDKLR